MPRLLHLAPSFTGTSCNQVGCHKGEGNGATHPSLVGDGARDLWGQAAPLFLEEGDGVVVGENGRRGGM